MTATIVGQICGECNGFGGLPIDLILIETAADNLTTDPSEAYLLCLAACALAVSLGFRADEHPDVAPFA